MHLYFYRLLEWILKLDQENHWDEGEQGHQEKINIYDIETRELFSGVIKWLQTSLRRIEVFAITWNKKYFLHIWTILFFSIAGLVHLIQTIMFTSWFCFVCSPSFINKILCHSLDDEK